MDLVNLINEDMKSAMKSKDSLTLNVVRMLKGAIQLVKIERQNELTNEDIIDIVSKQIKLRKDSIAEFSKAGRDDLIKQNQDEIVILSKYLPEQLTEEEVDRIITEVFQEVSPTSNKEMGLIMKKITPLVKGKADMGEVSKKIKDKLASLL